MRVADPYPVIDSRGDLTPIVRVTFYEVGLRISRLNLDDPQPPGYGYRLPLSREYDPWVEHRDLVAPVFSQWPVKGYTSCPPLCTHGFQEISYYEDGLWFHVGGSVYCWCGDPLTLDGSRVYRGGSWFSFTHHVRLADQCSVGPRNTGNGLGYRLVRGPLP